jgi:hypothetical protein
MFEIQVTNDSIGECGRKRTAARFLNDRGQRTKGARIVPKQGSGCPTGCVREQVPHVHRFRHVNAEPGHRRIEVETALVCQL